MKVTIGVDVGGTFTDVVLVDETAHPDVDHLRLVLLKRRHAGKATAFGHAKRVRAPS